MVFRTPARARSRARRKARSKRRPRTVRRVRYARRRANRPRIGFQTQIPDRLFLKLNYVQSFAASAPGGADAYSYKLYNLFRAIGMTDDKNCCYSTSAVTPLMDETASSAGSHQPLYWDQHKVMYDKYRVYGIKYHLIVENKTMNESWYVVIRRTATQTSEATTTSGAYALETMLERPDVQYRMGGSVNSSNAKVSMKGYMSVAKTLGVSPKEVNEDEYYQATVTGNPTRMAFLHAYIMNKASVTVTFDYHLRLTYYLVLEGRTAVATS